MKALLILFVVFLSIIPKGSSYCVEPDFDSNWIDFSASNTNEKPSFLEITHNLNSVELEVQVQVQINGGENAGFSFDASGFPQSDDDTDDYSGVTFAFNENIVRLWAPVRNTGGSDVSGTTGKAALVAVGVTGWSEVNKQLPAQGSVRVRIWRENFSKANYDTNWFTITESSPDQPYFQNFNHGLGGLPSRIKTLIRVENGANQGYYFSAATQAMKDSRWGQQFGGAVVAYNTSNILVFTPQFSSLGRVVFIGDGWGNENYAQTSGGAASARILAWNPQRYAADEVYSFQMTANNLAASYLAYNLSFIANHVTVSYQSQSTGLTFEAMGSCQGTDRKKTGFYPYGGLVFGRGNGNGKSTSVVSEVRIWAPYSTRTTVGNIVSLGPGWTNAVYAESTAQVTIKAWTCPKVYNQCPQGQFLNSTFDCLPCGCGVGKIDFTSCDSNGKCFCKAGFIDDKCTICAPGKFLKNGICEDCGCGDGKIDNNCDGNGKCSCKTDFIDDKCSVCIPGKYALNTNCQDCVCSLTGSNSTSCDSSGTCNCLTGFAPPKCSSCSLGYFGSNCDACNCGLGSVNSICNSVGQCSCKPHFIGDKCDKCQDGYYLSNGECVACGCGTKSFNQTCTDGNGQCFCPLNFASPKCLDCQSNFFGENCLSQCTIDCLNGKCNSGINGDGSCICNAGWSIGKTSQCDTCSSIAYGPSCTLCNCEIGGTDGSCNGQGVCSCKPHFIGDKCDKCQDGYYLSNGECVECGCGAKSLNQTCTDGNGQCFCPLNFASPKCLDCQPGFFGENCQSKCIDCLNGKCNSGINGNGNCDCNIGWSIGKTSQCDICSSDYFGSTCSKCPTCGNGICRSGLNGNGTCSCQVGWTGEFCSSCESNYVLVGPSCLACDSSCKKCSGTSLNSCSECYSGFFLENGYCKNTCSSSKYPGLNGACLDCGSTCKECIDENSCTICQDGLLYSNGLCLSQCPSGNFPLNSRCESCDLDCAECNGASNSSCTECRSDLFKDIDGFCVSNCQRGYFKNYTTMQCQKCQNNCLECNNLNTCTTCDSSSSTLNGKCYLTCPNGYFSSSGICRLCSTTCKTCFGSEHFQCTSCNANGGLPYLNKNTCVSSCSIGQYLSNNICEECSCNGFSVLCNSLGVCLNCQGNRQGNNCESCLPGYFMTDSNTCQACSCNGKSTSCKSGTGECENCSDNTQGSNCELCIDGFEKSSDGSCVSGQDNQKSNTTAIAVGVIVAGLLVCLIAGAFFYVSKKKKRGLVSPDLEDRSSNYFEIFPRKASSAFPDAGSTIVNTVFGSEISLPGFLKIRMNEIRVVDEIGAGGSGNVFSGEIMNQEIRQLFPKDSLKAAVKLVRALPNLSEEENTDNFHQEVSVNHALSFHPNICKLIAYAESPNAIVTPLYQGDLSQLIYNKSLNYTILDILDMTYHISSALEAIHDLGVSHRDIKPKNILMEARPAIETRAPGKLSNFPFNLRICDFGICHVKSSCLVVGFHKMRNQFGMSVRYASPESFHISPSSESLETESDYQKCDIFSFGVTMWEISHRTIPWENMDNPEIISRVESGQRPNITLKKDNRGSELICEMIDSSWDESPDKRPTSHGNSDTIFQFTKTFSDFSSLKSYIL